MTVRELLQLLLDMDNPSADVVFNVDGKPFDVEVVDPSRPPAIVYLTDRYRRP